ncbi:hypothetical protein PCC7418_0097 [Halothece sp. PCC 7418]|uniref:YtxH domain-containing protein n=1 Tax=Halothece sp. (strain PCC 7418) TaxID=65093 RepID=UPI0002A08901|nr:YtxH domain-containing protein [Halothece sp. PCC 7418]AFZ42345.1 hypothetical protein PCC7418_0097 [Halothece sp. PCC 7418]
MLLRTIKQIGLIIFCCGMMALSSGGGLTASAIAAPSPDDVKTEIQESAEDAKKAVEKGVEDAKEQAQDAKESIENKAKDAEEKAESEAKENGEGIIDKVKSLFSGD